VSEPASELPALPPGIDADGELEVSGLGSVAWITDVGHVRGRNEDRLLVKTAYGGDFLLLLVADGAGGHDSGDKAAEAVVAQFHEAFPEQGAAPEGEPDEWLRAAIRQAHDTVRSLGHGQARPPASTVVGLLVEKSSGCAWRFHVGDSRLYVRQAAGMVAQWTRDHNITNGLIDRGLPVQQALKIADGGRLTQVLGGASDPEAEIHGPLAVQPGQVFLLCTDGIYGHNGSREVLPPAMNPDNGALGERSQALKSGVLEGEAPDNLTAVLWQVIPDASFERSRATVTNSFRAVADPGPAAADGIGPGPGDDETDVAEERGPGGGAGRAEAPGAAGGESTLRGAALFLLALGIVALLFWGMRERPLPEPDPGPAGLTSEAARAVLPAPEELPWPEDPALRAKVEHVVTGLDPAFWQGQDPGDRAAQVPVLADLLRLEDMGWVTLALPALAGAAPQPTEMIGWAQPGAANSALAEAAWAARMRVLARWPDLAKQPGVEALLRRAGCRQVELRFPRGESTDPGDGVQLASWLMACLPPDATGQSLSLRLGAWPNRGISRDELIALIALARDPAAAERLRDPAAAGSPRALELALLARALAEPTLSSLQVDLTLAVPRADLAAPDAASAPLADPKSAEDMANLVRAVSGGVARVAGSFVSDEAVAAAADPALEQDPVARAAFADLNRRIDVALFRSAPLELDDAPLAPGAAGTSDAPAGAADAAPVALP
jgi:protein phosphatase